jgi:hypothetical protein
MYPQLNSQWQGVIPNLGWLLVAVLISHIAH